MTLTFPSPWQTYLTQPWFAAKYWLGCEYYLYMGFGHSEGKHRLSRIWGSLLVKMFTLFPLYSHICEWHTLLHALQIIFWLLRPWLRHSSLPSDLACCFFSVVTFGPHPSSVCFWVCLYGHSKASWESLHCFHYIKTFRFKEELNQWCWFLFITIIFQWAGPLTPINRKTWTSFKYAMKSTVFPWSPNDIWSEMECQL